jgi:hypothetical protein
MSVNSPSQETSVTPEPEQQFRLFARLVEHMTSRPLLPGNSLVAAGDRRRSLPCHAGSDRISD